MPSLKTILSGLLLVAFVAVGVFFRPPQENKQLRKLQATTPDQRLLIHGKDKLRIAVFGGGNAWGTGLKPRFDAFPYKLSPSVDNYAHPSSGPNYYSVCTETVVGNDKIYDVIIFDYWLKYGEGLEELARRLRQRFPKALFIFMRMWLPIHFKRKESPDAKENQSIKQWRDSIGISPNANINDVIKKLKEDNGYWYLPNHERADAAIAGMAAAFHGREFSFVPRASPKETLIEYLGFFDYKSHAHVNRVGHESITHQLTSLIKSALPQNGGDEKALVNSAVLGDWGNGDECKLWYNTGGAGIVYTENLTMNEFDEHNGWFGLEVRGPGSFNVTNKLRDTEFTTRTLWLSYITSLEENEYPRVEMRIDNNDGLGLGNPIVVDPLNTVDKRFNIRTFHVGQVHEAATATIHVKPLHTTPEPFRIVGASFSNERAQPLEYGFGPTRGGGGGKKKGGKRGKPSIS